MRFVKILGIALSAIAALILLGAVAVLLLVDPNDYKDELSAAVQEKTGRTLKLEGDLGLSLFPWLALKVGHIELGNAPGFDTVAFASIKSANVGVKLLPLLRGEIEIGRVKLEGLQLNLAVDAQGKSNWEDLTKHEEPAPAPAEKSRIKSTSIAGLTIEDSGLEYKDAQAGSHYRVSQLALQTGRLRPGEPADVKLSFKLDQGPDTTVLPFKLAIPALQLDLEKQSLQAPSFEMQLASAVINGSLNGQSIVDAPAFSGRIALKETSPRELLKGLGMEAPQTADPKALGALAFEAGLNATTKSVELQDMKLKLDDTQMTGRFAIEDLDTTALRFALTADQLNLDRYLAPEPPKDAKPAAAAAKAEPTPLPLDMLKELNAQGTVDVGALTISGVQLSQVKLKIDAQEGVVKLDPSQAKLYGGTHRGAVVLDARPNPAKLTVEEHLSAIDFAPLMLQLFESKRVSGRGSANAALAGRGNDSAALMKSLAGKIDFSVAEGAVEGADLWYELRRARALIKREAMPAQASTGRTTFNSMKGSATLADSVLENRDLDVRMDYLTVAGEGTVNLDSQAVDYRLKTTVYNPPADGAGAELQDLKSAEIPVRITGTLASLKVRPDIEGQVKAEAKKKIEEKKEEIKEKLTDKLNKWLEKKK